LDVDFGGLVDGIAADLVGGGEIGVVLVDELGIDVVSFLLAGVFYLFLLLL
jgi:hypothetical protein